MSQCIAEVDFYISVRKSESMYLIKNSYFFLATLAFIFSFSAIKAQELYVFSEPASNMPAKAISLKYTGKFLENYHSGKTEQRQALAAQLGLNKKWMLRVGTTQITIIYYSGNLLMYILNGSYLKMIT
jgi:hypothetical protein